MLYFLILCAVILAAVLLRSHYENTHFTRAYYLYKSRKIKDNIKIVFLSDLHESVFGRENQELADAIRRENPDYILLGGDSDYRKGEETPDRAGISFPDTDQRYLSGLLYLWKSRNQRKGAGRMEGLYQPG